MDRSNNLHLHRLASVYCTCEEHERTRNAALTADLVITASKAGGNIELLGTLTQHLEKLLNPGT